MREALSAYLAYLQERAIEQWRFDTLCYALSAPYQAKGSKLRQPKLPRVLRGPQ